MKKIIIGSRESILAQAQAQLVLDYLNKEHPELDVSILTMKTTGDKILDRTLYEIGGKGLFVKELDSALREGRTDLSVHSLKDLPIEVPDDLPIICYSKREDPRDVLVLPPGDAGRTLEEISKPVGTSSLRRILQLRRLYPQLKFANVRGNLHTRLRRLDEGEYGALILAAAGLRRLGLEDRISRYFDTEKLIPSAGQGILAVQGRHGDNYEYLKEYADRDSALAACCERSFVRALNGSCSSPIAAYAHISGNRMELTGFYATRDLKKMSSGKLSADVTDPGEAKSLGQKLAGQIMAEISGKNEANSGCGK